MRYRLVGTNILRGDPTGTILVPVSDTLHFEIKSVPPIIAKIASAENIQIIGNRINVLNYLETDVDTLKLGERVRLFGEVIGNGRPDDFPYYLYEWLTQEDLHGPTPGVGIAGFDRIDTTMAISGLIFYPQTFFFRVEDVSTYGCFSTDSVRIYVRLAPEPHDFGEIPGGFSPLNNDGINDIFMKGVDEITILNRWGVVIFQSTNKEGWDGRNSRTNRMVERGDYFYIITIYENNDNTIKHTKTGVVTVF